MENDAAAKKTEERLHRSGPVLTMARSRRKETIFVWAMLALPIVHFCIFYIWLNFNSRGTQRNRERKARGYPCLWRRHFSGAQLLDVCSGDMVGAI